MHPVSPVYFQIQDQTGLMILLQIQNCVKIIFYRISRLTAVQILFAEVFLVRAIGVSLISVAGLHFQAIRSWLVDLHCICIIDEHLMA